MKNILFLSLLLAFASCEQQPDCPDYSVIIGKDCADAVDLISGTYEQETPGATTTIETYSNSMIVFNKSNICTGQYGTLSQSNPMNFTFQPQTYQFLGESYNVISGSGHCDGTTLTYLITIEHNGQTTTDTFTGTRQ